MQIAVGERYHPVRYALHRMRDGPGKAQDQQHGDYESRQGCQNGYQHGPVNKMAVIRLGDLDDQRPLGSPDGRKGHQHLFPIDGKFYRPCFPGGDPLHCVLIAAAELNQRALAEGKGLVRMAGNDALPVNHIGHAGSAQVDAADHIVKQVIFIRTHHIKGSLAVLLHRDPHRNAQLALKEGGGADCQIIRLLQQRQKAAVQGFRRTVDPLHQPPVQVIQGDCVKFIDLRRFLQYRPAVFGGGRRIPAEAFCSVQTGCHCVHPGITGNGHHAVGQHMNVGLHCLSRLPGHRLKAVQQYAVGE